ncbi:SulP family inorganic anion transporter [Winogradskyella sp. YYF002]|uniref:SulP family inorganic anion transporter n=1 Tax=Winogradskyella marincola TaxID=3037795 RepID=A0ABT6G244_9FLAO|nr:SulP family inorganic anion transporter [Winogradskyella sp. YYF002]MDG4716105.1 SulP family inorganic anion transporter [Winogradskyella sp. YYF002]
MFKSLKSDIPASIVVFFVALPLCLGISVASGAEPITGLIAGIVGGIIVGAASGSKIGVSGPAAGLAVIVAAAIANLGYENFLVAVVLAGVFQIILGVFKAGIIGYYFPSSVIKGMLTGIGIVIILKEIPYFFGIDKNPEGDWAFLQVDGENTLSELLKVINALISGNFDHGATIIAVVSMGILLLWGNVLSKKGKFFNLVQGPLVAVLIGIVYYFLTKDTGLELSKDHLVSVPVPDSLAGLKDLLTFPNFSALSNPKIYITAFTIGLVASLETLLCVEATDKLDPEKNVTPTNRELFAQGSGNIVSGLIGGLPVTQVIVRSSANIQSGGKSKASAVIHGFLLLISIITIPTVLNLIPLSVLAAILFIVGYKLAKPSTFKAMYNSGWMQFVPFIVTVIGIVFIDLLWGIGLGLAVGIFVVLYKSYKNSHFLHKEGEDVDDGKVKMTLAEEVTFFNKGAILKELDRLPENSTLELDVTKTKFLDNDIVEILEDFSVKAKERNINIKLFSERGIVENPESFIAFFKLEKKK